MNLSFRPASTRLLCALILVAGTAAAQQQASTAQTTGNATSAQSSSSASSSAPATKLSSADAAQATLEKDTYKKAMSLGYRVYSSGGQTQYCRTETPVGTRFPHKVCKTPQQIEDMIQNEQAVATQFRTLGCSGNCGSK